MNRKSPGYRAFIQQPTRERSSASVRTVDQQTPASSQRRRHRGKYQLDLDFADAAHVHANFEKLSEPCAEDMKVAAYRETSPFFPESVVDRTKTRRIAQGGPEDSAAIRVPTSLFTNGTETTQQSAEGRFGFPATPSAKLSTHQSAHASEMSSQQHSSTISYHTKLYGLDEQFDRLTEHHTPSPQAFRMSKLSPATRDSPLAPTIYEQKRTINRSRQTSQWPNNSLERTHRHLIETSQKHSSSPTGRPYWSRSNPGRFVVQGPRGADHRSDPHSSIFSTPQKQLIRDQPHQLGTCFPLSYSGGRR